MGIPSSSSNSSSPSFTVRAHSSDDVAAACFNPLFITTSSASHMNCNPNQTQNCNSTNHNYHSHNHSSISIIKNHQRVNLNKNHSQSNITSISLAGNSSPDSMQFTEARPSRKVHVVYYLSRSGQLEHPHLLEVSIPPNQGLYLRDVKKRLAAIRGKRLPSTFAWSYKRSYKNGYVWQDLCDDDLIFPAHGCEYVLKGSEILSDQSNNEECTDTPEARLTTQNGSKEDQGLTGIIPREVYGKHEETRAAASLCVSMVESGTDAATQTEEERRRSDVEYTHEHEENSNSLYVTHYKLNTKQLLSSTPRKVTYTSSGPQYATELNRTDMASPPSSSSATNPPSPYKELANTSSSSAGGFNMPADQHNDNAASNENVKTTDHNLGSKTPGRSWMKHVTDILEEHEETISLCATDQEGGMSNVGGLANPPHDGASSKSKHRSMASNSIGAVIMEEGERSPTTSAKPGRSKHSGALSLLQFMSCGGLDIKEQILPLSLYRLRSKGAPAAANQHQMSNYMLSPEHSGSEASGYGGSETGKLWTKIGKPKSLYSSPKPLYKASDESNGECDVDNQWVHCKYQYPQHEGASAVQATSPSQMVNGSSSTSLGGSVPDVISIGRSSLSDRSTNVSHEFECHIADAHGKLRKNGEVMSTHNNGMKGSPRFNARPEISLDVHNLEGARSTTVNTVGARAVSGEILMSKESPLFVASKRHLNYSGTPLNYASNSKPPLAQPSTSVAHIHEAGNNQTSMRLDVQNKACSSSSNPSRAFSEGEVLASRIVASNQRSMTINSYDRSMAQLWEELLAAPNATKSEEHQQKCSDYQRVRTMGSSGSSSSSWEVERTLQNAVELSLQPPLEHLPLLLDCPQCGRKVKAELLKAHVKNCSSPKPNARSPSSLLPTPPPQIYTTNSALGKSPKSDSNLCQRFLRASPFPLNHTPP